MSSLWPKHTGWWLAATLSLVGFGVTFSLTRQVIGALLAWACFGGAAAIVISIVARKKVLTETDKTVRAAQIIGAALVTMFLLSLPVWIFPFTITAPPRSKIRTSRQIGLGPDQAIIVNIYLASDGPAQATGVQHFTGMRLVPAPFEGFTMHISKTKANEDALFADLRRNMSQATEPSSKLPAGHTQFFSIPGPKLLPDELSGKKQINRDGQVLLVGGIVTYRDQRGAPRREIEFCFYLLSNVVQITCFEHNSED